MLQAVILAGGLGTRLRAVDSEVPKPMIDVAGKPFLHYMLKMLEMRGITDVLLLLGYKSEVVTDYLDSSSCYSLNIQCSVEPSPIGTGGALKLAESLLADEFFLLNGDSYLDVDFSDIAGRFSEFNKDCLMVVYDNNQDTDVINNVGVSDRGSILCYSKDAGGALTHVEAGILVYKKSVMKLVPEDSVFSMENDLYQDLIDKGNMSAYVTSQRFYDIGTPERLKEFEEVVHGDLLGNKTE